MSNYYQTLKDGLSGKVTPGQAFKAAKNTSGGVLGKNSLTSALSQTGARVGRLSNKKSKTKKIETAIDRRQQDFNSNSGNSSVEAPGFDFSSIEGPSSSGVSGSSSSRNVVESLSRGWDDTGDLYDTASKALKKSKKYISNLGKVKKQYKESLDKYKSKYDTAIAGNKKLIQQNQKGELDDLGEDTRGSVKNTNIMLGVSGASGGSASKMASRAIAKSAGKSRAKILTQRGDDMSNQKQAEEHALEEYKTKLRQAEEWEENEREKAEDAYDDAKKALKRLKRKRSGWKKEDIKAENDKNLTKYMEALLEISASANAMRNELDMKMQEFGGSADALELESINVDAPAELDTPDFSETIDLDSPEDAEDWYDPNNKKKKKVIKGRDALGNPIYEDEEVIE